MILAITALGLYVIARWDRPLYIQGKAKPLILAGALTETVCIAKLLRGEAQIYEGFLWAVMGGSLLLACVTDCLICQVYNFTWWIYLVALALLWYCMRGALWRGKVDLDALGGLLVYLGMQLILAGRIYGKADSYAFCVCALTENLLDISFVGMLVHMLLAYLLLFVIQVARHNVNRKGNLHKGVPFLPYITVSFWMTVVFFAYT